MEIAEAIERCRAAGYGGAHVRPAESPGLWEIVLGDWTADYPRPAYAPLMGIVGEDLGVMVRHMFGPGLVHLAAEDASTWGQTYRAIGPHALRELGETLVRDIGRPDTDFRIVEEPWGLELHVTHRPDAVTTIVMLVLPSGQCEVRTFTRLRARDMVEAFRFILDAREAMER